MVSNGDYLTVVLAITLCCLVPRARSISCAGCVDLDEINFDKTVARFPYALVKFDIAFPYGDKHEAFASFSKAAHKVTDDLLVATVGIKDYGESENKPLGERFKIDDKNYPGIILFYGDAKKDYLQYPAHLDVTLENLKSFVTKHTTLYIGREGCMKELNYAVKNYVNLEKEKQLALIKEWSAKKAELTKESEQQSVGVYLMYMRKINEIGYNFVDQETKRLLRLKAGKVADTKKLELQQKLNILEAFRVNKLTKAVEQNEEL